MTEWRWPIALALALALPWAGAQVLQPVPPLTARVMDEAAMLTPEQRADLARELSDFETRSGTQLSVLTVARIAPEDIASYAHRVASDWRVGRRDVGDGVLLVLVRDERRVRIEVAQALEGTLPDLAAARIIDTAIAPAMRQGDAAAALQGGTRAVMAALGSPTPVEIQAASAAETLTPRPAEADSDPWLRQPVVRYLAALMAVGALLGWLLGRLLARTLPLSAPWQRQIVVVACIVAGAGFSVTTLMVLYMADGAGLCYAAGRALTLPDLPDRGVVLALAAAAGAGFPLTTLPMLLAMGLWWAARRSGGASPAPAGHSDTRWHHSGFGSSSSSDSSASSGGGGFSSGGGGRFSGGGASGSW